MMRLSTSLAVAGGRLIALASRRLQLGGGTTVPGLLALRLAPRLISELATGLRCGAILIAGTNGKTTTARLVSSILKEAGYTIVQNRSGANLDSGVASAMIRAASPFNGLSVDWGVFEADEAALPGLAVELQPKVVALLNLFRDQLDRYGEIDAVLRLWRGALERLEPEATVVYNGDDPAITHLVEGLPQRIMPFSAELGQSSAPEHAADSLICPRCERLLEYQAVSYSHLGRFRCGSCGFANQPASVVVRPGVEEGSAVELLAGEARRPISFPLAGVYNLYNLAGAAAIAQAASLGLDLVARASENSEAVFGRMESVVLDGRKLTIALIKNPVGCNQVLATIGKVGPGAVTVIAINDNLADGTDVSWLWDADFEKVADWPCRFVVSGARAGDMAVRLRYAGVDSSRIEDGGPDVSRAVTRTAQMTPAGQRIMVLPTYSALLSLHTFLARKGLVRPFWSE